MYPFSFTCFGPLTITLDGEPIAGMSADKSRALLAYLVVESDRAHSRSSLIGLLWPDYPQKDALRSLRNSLYRLRQLLDKSASNASVNLLSITRQTLQFHPVQAAVDVARFEMLLDTVAAHQHQQIMRCSTCLNQMVEAAALYKGELLAGLRVADAPAFEEWLLTRREYLHLRALFTLQVLTDAYEAMGDEENAYRFATQRLTLDPYQESALQAVIRLAAQRGLPDQALAYYDRFRQLLWKESSIEPSAETTDLAEQIRRGELDRVVKWQSGKGAELREPIVSLPKGGRETEKQGNMVTEAGHIAPSSLHPVTLSPPSSASTLRNVPQQSIFFGRRAELAQLEQWLVDDRCCVVAILGIGGMGKTSLAAQFVHQTASRFDTIVWYSLLNAPLPQELLPSLLQTLSNQTAVTLPNSLDRQLQLLMQFLRERHILLVLDNLESIFEPGQAGVFRAGYEPYAQFVSFVASHEHNSRLLLTSRERPQGYARLEGDHALVRSLRLDGLDDEAGYELLAQRGLDTIGDDAHCTLLWQSACAQAGGRYGR
ncbi:hypothetical protein KFU94_55390 [Chloroflexi bacterium TSY]|nr:hypothetical protein [Chloroflexi bacterium TSY]